MSRWSRRSHPWKPAPKKVKAQLAAMDNWFPITCARCGHSMAQHTKGPVAATYCRHCPCPAWVARSEGTA